MSVSRISDGRLARSWCRFCIAESAKICRAPASVLVPNRSDWSGSPTVAIAENGHNSGAGLYRNLVRFGAIRCNRP
jgi:hypothetical protein